MPRSKREVSEVGKNQNANDFFTCAGSYRMLLSCRGRGPPPGRRSRRARAAGRRSCPRRARLAAARCRPTPRMASAPARMRSPWRVVLSLFPLLSVGGGREEELQLEERSSRRGKREASEGECWASSRCRDRRREGSYEQERRMERASKKEEGKTEETKTEKKNVSLSPRSAPLCASQLNLFFNFPPFPSSTFYSSPQVRKNRRRCPRDLLSAPGVPRGTAAEQSGGFRGEGGGRAAV